jgi:hypothetical protein
LKTAPTQAAATSNLIDPKEVGHNIYILAHQLSRHNEELSGLLNPDNIKEPSKTKTALEFYRSHTANIEVSSTGSANQKCIFYISSFGVLIQISIVVMPNKEYEPELIELGVGTCLYVIKFGTIHKCNEKISGIISICYPHPTHGCRFLARVFVHY